MRDTFKRLADQILYSAPIYRSLLADPSVAEGGASPALEEYANGLVRIGIARTPPETAAASTNLMRAKLAGFHRSAGPRWQNRYIPLSDTQVCRRVTAAGRSRLIDIATSHTRGWRRSTGLPSGCSPNNPYFLEAQGVRHCSKTVVLERLINAAAATPPNLAPNGFLIRRHASARPLIATNKTRRTAEEAAIPTAEKSRWARETGYARGLYPALAMALWAQGRSRRGESRLRARRHSARRRQSRRHEDLANPGPKLDFRRDRPAGCAPKTLLHSKPAAG